MGKPFDRVRERIETQISEPSRQAVNISIIALFVAMLAVVTVIVVVGKNGN